MSTATLPIATLIIGIGNEWRGDDGVGPWIVSALRDKNLPNVKTVPNVADGLDLLNVWRDANTAYVIDALRGCGAPGTIIRVNALTENLPTETGYSSHTFGLAEAIELGRTLNSLPKELIVIGIEGHDFAMGNSLSPAIESAAKQVIVQLCEELCFRPSQSNVKK